MQGSGGASFLSLKMTNQLGKTTNTFVIGDDIIFEITISSREKKRSARMSLDIATSDGIPVYHLLDVNAGFSLEDVSNHTVVRVALKNSKLYPGDYLISLWLGEIDTNPIDYLKDCTRFTVAEGGGIAKGVMNRRLGLVYEPAHWERVS